MLTLTTFIDEYAKKNEITKRQSREEIERFVDTFKQLTYECGGITIIGFIKSEVKEQSAREYINPKTREKGFSEAKTVVKVKGLDAFHNMTDRE